MREARLVDLPQLEKAIKKDMEGACVLVEALQKENEETRAGSDTSTFSATVGWKNPYKKGEVKTKVFVKSFYADPENVTIPTGFLNEMYLMNTVVRDFILNDRSPHFVFPVTQIYGKKQVSNVLELETMLGKDPELGCRTKDGKLGLYNVMEYFDPEEYFTMKDFIDIDATPRYHFMLLRQVFFQVLYTLSLMGKYRFCHGDLGLDNLMVKIDRSPITRFYSPDSKTYYLTQLNVLMYMVDFDKSSIDSPSYKTAKLSDAGEWNPYADWTRFISSLLNEMETIKGRNYMQDVLSGLFPSESLRKDVMAVVQDRVKYSLGRRSLRELKDTVSEKILSRMTPEKLLKKVAEEYMDIDEEYWLIPSEKPRDVTSTNFWGVDNGPTENPIVFRSY